MPQINFRLEKEEFNRFLQMQLIMSSILDIKITQPELLKMALDSLQDKVKEGLPGYENRIKAVEKIMSVFFEDIKKQTLTKNI